MQKNRKQVFDYNHLSSWGRYSLWLGNRKIYSSLKAGSWLDILSGFESLLQVNRLRSNKITDFHCLDIKLNERLSKLGIKCKEYLLKDKIPFGSNCFDNVTIVNGLEHLWRPQAIINESYRILSKNGVLQIIAPTWFAKPILEFYAFTIKNPQAEIEMNDHKTYYDEKALWPMFVKAGFKPKNINMKRIKFFCALYVKAIKE